MHIFVVLQLLLLEHNSKLYWSLGYGSFYWFGEQSKDCCMHLMFTQHCTPSLTITPSLSHHHYHTITITPSLSHHHYHTITITPSLSHHHYHTITITPSLSHHHYHTTTITTSLTTKTNLLIWCNLAINAFLLSFPTAAINSSHTGHPARLCGLPVFCARGPGRQYHHGRIWLDLACSYIMCLCNGTYNDRVPLLL